MYVLTQDIVIPAGTEVAPGPVKSTYFTVHGEVTIGHGPDATSHWRIDLDEAVELGIIEEKTE